MSKDPKEDSEDKVPTEHEKNIETLDLESKRLENFEKKLQISGRKTNEKLEESRIVIDKINSLRWLLEGTMYDADGTHLASEPKFKNMFETHDREIISKKIMNMVKKL